MAALGDAQPEEPEWLLWAVVLLLLTLQAPLSIPHNWPGWAGPEWEPGEGAALRPAGAKSHKPQCLHFPTLPPPSLGAVCREGKGQGWRPQVISPRTGHSLASSGREGGAHSVSHEAFLSPLPGRHPGPHIWLWGGDSGWRSTHFRPPSLLSPAFCSWGPSFGG